MSLWSTLLFYKSLHLFKKIYSFSPILHFPHGYQQFLPTIFTHNFYPQYFHRFPQIFTDLHRFILPFSLYFSIFYSAPCLQDLHRSSTDLSKIFQKFSFLHPLSLGTWTVGHSGPLSSFPQIQPLFIHFLLGTLSPRSSQIFHRSFKDLSTIFLPPSPFTWYLDSRSFRPTLQFSKSPFLFTSLIPTVLHRSSIDLPIFFSLVLPSFPTSWYLDSRSFRPTLQISKFSLSSLISTVHHRSLTDLPKLLFFLHPFLLGIWTVGHSGPLSRSPSFSFPPFSLQFVTDPPQVFQKYLLLHPLLLIIWTVGHSGPLSSSPSPSISSLIPTLLHRSFTDLPRSFSSSIPYYLVSGQSVIPAHSPASQSPFLFLFFLIHLHPSSTDPSNIFLSPSLIPWYPDSLSFYQFFQDGGSTPNSSPNSHDHSS